MVTQDNIFSCVQTALKAAPSHHQRTGRPYVTLSYAQSIDGCIAFRSGRPLALSGSQSMILTHKLRSVHDAILVGIGTIVADNPRLTVRHVLGGNPQPIILDSGLRLPLEAHVLKNRRRPPWIVTAEEADTAREEPLKEAGARILRVPTQSHGLLDLSVLLQRLGEMHIISLMVEGGAQIITSFLENQFVNQLILTMAPVLVGGLRAVNPLQLDLSNLPRLKNLNYELFGEDLVLSAEPAYDDI